MPAAFPVRPALPAELPLQDPPDTCQPLDVAALAFACPNRDNLREVDLMSRPAAGSGAFALPAYVNDNWPPVLMRREAASMCRISVATFDSWVRKAILPKPIPGTRRWSRVAIERALAGGDRTAVDIQLSAFDQWRRDRAH